MSFSQSLVYKIHQIVYTLDEVADQLLISKFGITYNEFMVLNLIFNYPEINQQSLASVFRIGRSAISQRLSKLEKKDLIKRKLNINSKRDKNLSLTKKGLDLFQKTSQLLNQSSQQVFASLKDPKKFEQELDFLIKTLQK